MTTHEDLQDLGDQTQGPEEGATRNLTARTLSGVKWTYIAAAISAVLQIVYAAVMGRLLAPSAFGLLAMAMLALRFATYFARMGINQALIQKPSLSTEEIRAGFTSTVILGASFGGLAWAMAPWAGRLFATSDVVGVLRGVSISLVLAGFGSTAQSLLRREFRFRELSIITVTSHAVGGLGVGIAMAASGAGVWSLVAAILAQTAMSAALTYSRVRHSVLPMMRLNVYRPLLRYGSRLSIISFMEFIGFNLDTLVVGRYASAAALGYYNRAYMLVTVPLNNAILNLSKVAFPSMSRIQTQTERLRAVYLSMVRLGVVLLIPGCAGIAVAAREIVLVVLGSQWVPVITLLPIVAVAGALEVFAHFSGVVCDVRAELNRKMLLQSAYLVILAAALSLAVGSPLWAFATAFAVSKALLTFGYFKLMSTVLGVGILQYARIWRLGLFASVAVASAIAIVRVALIELSTPLVVVLVSEVLAGALALWSCFRFTQLKRVVYDVAGYLDRAGVAGPGSAVRKAVVLATGEWSNEKYVEN